MGAKQRCKRRSYPCVSKLLSMNLLRFSHRARIFVAVSVAIQLIGIAYCRAENRSEYLSRLAVIESLSFPKLPLRFQLNDDRTHQRNNLDLETLRLAIRDSLETLGYTLLEPLETTKVRPVTLRLGLSYYGTFRTEAKKKLGIRCIGTLHHLIESTEREDREFSISFDRLLERNLKYLKKRSNANLLETYLADQVTAITIGKIVEILTAEQAAYREAVTLGSAPVDSKSSELQNKKRAIVNALGNACERAWGSQIEASTEIVDIQDVSDFVSQNYGCRVIDYEVLPEYTVFTDDGYVCVVVRSISQEK